MLEQRLQELFEHQAADLPLARASVDTAIGRGRGRRRRQRMARIGSVIVATAAIGIAATAVADRGPAPAAARPHPTTAIAPRSFSAQQVYVRFGWLPPGVTVSSGQARVNQVSLAAGPSVKEGSIWSLIAFPRGACTVGRRTAACKVGLPVTITGDARDVNGLPAFWGSGEGGPGSNILAFQYARGGWAFLIFPSRADAMRVADHVQSGPGVAIRYPARLIGLPSSWWVYQTNFYPGPVGYGAYQYDVSEQPREHPASDSIELGKGSPQPANESATACGLGTGAVRMTLNGYPVYAQNYSASVATMCVPDADGSSWLIQVFQRRSVDVVPLFEYHMRLLGPDPTRWTTVPIG